MLPVRVRGSEEAAEIVAALTAQGKGEQLAGLGRLRSWKTLLAIALEWAAIVGAWALVLWGGLWLAPAAVLVVGTRQRALSTLLHEAAHWLLVPDKEGNNRLGNWLLAYPLLNTVRHFRGVHLRHHAFLGDLRRDADFHHDEQVRAWHPLTYLLRAAASPREWLTKGVVGATPSLHASERLRVLLWWCAALVVLWGISGSMGACTFVLLWCLARATVYYFLGVTLDVTDHVGLRPGSVVGFTRNCLMWGGSLALHPYHNGYHLAHHLFLDVPWYNLGELHRLCLGVPSYARGHHCDGYAGGRHSLFSCIRGQCNCKGD